MGKVCLESMYEAPGKFTTARYVATYVHGVPEAHAHVENSE